jgi:hypothetical protein
MDDYAKKMDEKGFKGREIVEFTMKALAEAQK